MLVTIIRIFPSVRPSSLSLIFKSLTLQAAQHRSMDSALIIKSTAYSSFHGQPICNSLDGGSNTMIKRSLLRTGPNKNQLLAAHCFHFFLYLSKYSIVLTNILYFERKWILN